MGPAYDGTLAIPNGHAMAKSKPTKKFSKTARAVGEGMSKQDFGDAMAKVTKSPAGKSAPKVKKPR